MSMDPELNLGDALDLEPEAQVDALVETSERERSAARRRARAQQLREQYLAEQETQATPQPRSELSGAPAEEDDGGILSSIGSGVLNAPGNVVGGIRDGLVEAVETLDDIANASGAADLEAFLEEQGLPSGIFFGPEGVTFNRQGVEEGAERVSSLGRIAELVPEIGDPEDQDSAVRAISQFVTGFAVGGKALRGLRGAAQTVRGGQTGLAALQGAIADFAFVDEMDNPVNALVETFPSLEGPITEFLDADEENSDLQNRLTNSLAGAGLGAVTDTVMGGLRILRSLRKTKGAAETAEAVMEDVVQRNTIQREEFTRLLGDAELPAVELKRIRGGAGGGAHDEVFINWARIDTEDEIKQAIQTLADNDSAGIQMAQRGTQSRAETELLAGQEDAWQLIADRIPGGTWNAEQSLAVRKLWALSGRKTLELAEQVRANPSDVATVAFQKQLSTHAMIQRAAIGARTETARALAQWRIPAGDDLGFLNQMDTLLAQSERGVPAALLAEATHRLARRGRMDAMETFIYGSPALGQLTRFGGKLSDAVTQWWYFSLLGRATTHVRNFVGNTARIGMEIGDRKVASYLGQALGEQNVPTGEATAYAHGAVQGLKDAFRVSSEGRLTARNAMRLYREGEGEAARELLGENAGEFGGFWRTLTTGDTGFGVNKVDVANLGAMDPEKLGFDPASNIGRVFRLLDTVTSSTTRGLAASDELFKTMNFRAELHAQGLRRATDEVASGALDAADLDRRVAELVSDPDEGMQLLARQMAEENTFTNRPRDSRFWTAFRGLGQIPVFGRLVLPFSRTPYNIAIENFQRTPILGQFTKRWQEDVLAGGAKADIAWGRFLSGSAILIGFADLAMNGTITGDQSGLSTTGAERAHDREMGVHSMSYHHVAEDGTVTAIPLRGFEPLTWAPGLAANLVEILSAEEFQDENKELDDLVVAASFAIGAQLQSANYLRGTVDIMNAMSDPTRYGPRWFENMARSVFAPGISQQFVNANDGIIREVEDWMGAVRAGTPGLSDGLNASIDRWGFERERPGDWKGILQAISPRTTRPEDVPAITRELDELEKFIGKPQKSRVTFRGVNVNMGRYPDAWERYQRLQGNALDDSKEAIRLAARAGRGVPQGYVPQDGGQFAELNAIVSGRHPSSSYYRLLAGGAQGGKALFIQDVVSFYRAAAREKVLQEFPELEAEVFRRREEAPRKFEFDTAPIVGP